MIGTKNLGISEIPESWIFEHYAKLDEKLHGQDIRMRSVFHTEKTASMFIYYKDGKYKFKDFSTGHNGGAIDFVKALLGVPYLPAVKKIESDYSKRKADDHEEIKMVPESKFKVTSHVKRKWNELDEKYWTQFNIGSELLGKYNVFPLESFKMSKDVDGDILDIDNRGQGIYGYFKSNGTLAKIYRPKNKSLKFINVNRFIQGSDQLTYKAPTLIICSSLKDGMALESLNFKDVEFIAPNSENSTISAGNLSAYLLKYKNVRVLFDNDQAGQKSMVKYEREFGIQGIYLNLSKDISDSVKEHGAGLTKRILTSLLPKT